MSLVARISDDEVIRRESLALKAERAWLFERILPRAVEGIRAGLKECASLLNEAVMTLPITSRETECLKGIMTRHGSQLIKGDLSIKMSKLELRLAIPKGRHIHLQQVEDVGSLVHYSLESLAHELYEDTARRIVGDILLNVRQALQALSKSPPDRAFPLTSLDSDSLRPELPHHVALDMYIQEASLVSEIRVVQPRRAETLFASLRKTAPVETGLFVRYRGEDVRVLEHVRVESQDPALIAISAKLTALKHSIEEVQKKLIATAT